MIFNNIENDWKQLAKFLKMDMNGTSENQSSYKNLQVCFESAKNCITWKIVKSWLQHLERDDLVQQVINKTTLTNGKNF